MTHLTDAELAAEVKLIADPFNLPDDDDSPVPSHLRECASCRGRLGELFAEYTAAENARMLEDMERTASEGHLDDLALASLLEEESGIASPRKEDTLVRGHLRRCAVCQQKLTALQAEERAFALAVRNAGESFFRNAMSAPDAAGTSMHRAVPPTANATRSLMSRRTLGALNLAAGLGIAVLVPALHRAITTGEEPPVSVVSAESVRDSVTGFANKEYLQHVSAGSKVNLVVEGITTADFDCLLYDGKKEVLVEAKDGLGNSCQFSITPNQARDYRLVVQSTVGTPVSYVMVKQVVRDSSRAKGAPDEPVAP